MESFKETLAYWSSILGSVLGLLGAIQSVPQLTWFGSLTLVASTAIICYARRLRQRLDSAIINVTGRSIDSLNMANLRRRINRSLVIQEVHTTAEIRGADLAISWECVGYCRAKCETNLEFSVDSDNSVPYGELNCYAYDLECDPERNHRIRPLLVGPDGLSKKIAVPFLAALRRGDPFHLVLTYVLPGCMKAGVDYCVTSLSLGQDQALRYAFRLTFVGSQPTWLRVYESSPSSPARLLKDVQPQSSLSEGSEYMDSEPNASPKSARIYVFHRPATLQEPHGRSAEAMLAGAAVARPVKLSSS